MSPTTKSAIVPDFPLKKKFADRIVRLEDPVIIRLPSLDKFKE